MPETLDDKSEYCIPFILDQLEKHKATHKAKKKVPPFIIGLNGVQGAGKTTLVSVVYGMQRSIARSECTGCSTIDKQLSILSYHFFLS